jgi:hypothetical protein
MGIADGPSEVHKITVAKQVLSNYSASTDPMDIAFTPYNRINRKKAAIEKVKPVLEAAGVDLKVRSTLLDKPVVCVDDVAKTDLLIRLIAVGQPRSRAEFDALKGGSSASDALFARPELSRPQQAKRVNSMEPPPPQKKKAWVRWRRGSRRQAVERLGERRRLRAWSEAGPCFLGGALRCLACSESPSQKQKKNFTSFATEVFSTD